MSYFLDAISLAKDIFSLISGYNRNIDFKSKEEKMNALLNGMNDRQAEAVQRQMTLVGIMAGAGSTCFNSQNRLLDWWKDGQPGHLAITHQ